MKRNIGFADRIFRMLAVIIIAALYFTNQITGTAAIVLGLLAIIFLATSFLGVCPLYLLFGVSTKNKSS